MMRELQFFIFSYNRGDFLANCVRSIEECVPHSPIAVIDDGSTDETTVSRLRDIESRHTVVRTETTSRHKHGGLYRNMQRALDIASPGGLACFIQDDTQIVRGIGGSEVASLFERFEQHEQLAFLSVTFLKGISLRRKGGVAFSYDAGLGVYFPGPSRHSAGAYYSDVSIAHVDRLRAAGWQFRDGEPANEIQASDRFGRMGYLPLPFVMWLPNAPAYRGRSKSLSLRLAERHRRAGLYPIRYMTPAEVRALAADGTGSPPIAEDWLTTVEGSPARPWRYDPMQGLRLLKQLDRLEQGGRRMLRAARERLTFVGNRFE